MPSGIYIRKPLNEEKTKHKSIAISKANKGRKLTLKQKQKIRKAKLNLSNEARKNMSIAQKRRNMRKENNPNWKGKKVGYVGLHNWIKRHKKKLKECQICKKEKKLYCANLSTKYFRDVADYIWLCAKCHWHFDRNNNFKKENMEKIANG